MKKLFITIAMLLALSSMAHATLTVNAVPRVKTGGSSPTLQDSSCSVNDSGLLSCTAVSVTSSSGSAKISSATGFDFDAANAVYTSSSLNIAANGSITVGGSGYSSFPGGIDVTNSSELRSGGNRINYNLITPAVGTVYSLTNTDAAVAFGTTSPAITIDKTGTYLLYATGRLKYNATTFAAAQTATMHLRRTNNTAADVSGATTTLQLRILTTTTDSAGSFTTAPIIYTTANTNDAVALWGALSASTGAGSVDVTEASVIAVRLY